MWWLVREQGLWQFIVSQLTCYIFNPTTCPDNLLRSCQALIGNIVHFQGGSTSMIMDKQLGQVSCRSMLIHRPTTTEHQNKNLSKMVLLGPLG